MSAPAAAIERQVVRAVGSIGTATLVSRVLGFVRDVVLARAFGAGGLTDAFVVAFRIPNILRRLLAEGALSTAVVPVFTDYLTNRSRAEARAMLGTLMSVALLVLTTVTVIGIAAAPWILPVIAPGFSADPAQAALAVLLTRVMFPYLVLVGLAALAMGVLNAQGRFFAAALGPALLNVGMIAGVLVLAPRVTPPILGVALGVLLGGAAQLAVQLPPLARAGLLVSPARSLRHPAVRRVVRLLGPSVFGLAAVQIMVFVNTLLASWLPAGSISFLYYADRVMEFPHGVFGIALASASLPAMSRQAAAGDRPGLAGTLNFALRLSCYIAVPATVGLVLLRAPIVRVLFERGQFTPAATAATAEALAWYAAGLVGFSGARIAAQAFYALGEPGTAVRAGIVAVGVNVVAAVVLMPVLSHAGLAAASSLGAAVNLATLVASARRRFGRIGGHALAASLARTLAATAPLAAWCVAARALWPVQPRLAVEATWLAGAIVAGAGVFWLASGILARPERDALARLRPGRREV
ncbi:MAG: murein biosynthesis integral membrane protein MurJ [Candidatus Rokubacteria bacterium]|nr:murein biosynthesis integral membrane protein MurJ [Candidatus Rokubacteria bacterium]MBI3825350.1 murein biosynthesis integral membrane protein MurJ [Candidatus Rokubacteria bacterium]